MTTPVKSPLQKKHRGDAALDDDLQITKTSQGVTLSAIEQLLDKKLDPLNQFLQQIRLDLGAFKESVRVEFESMGLRVSETEHQVCEAISRVEKLEQEFVKMQQTGQGVHHPEASNPRSLGMMKGCRTVGITPPGPCVQEGVGVQLGLREMPK